MARLKSHVEPFEILQTAEGIDQINGLLAVCVGIGVIAAKLPAWQIGLAVFVAHLGGYVLALNGILLPGLVPLATAFSRVTGYGIVTSVVSGAGFFAVGWEGALAYVSGLIAANVVEWPIEWSVIWKRQKVT